MALKAAFEAARKTPAEPVPLHLRNAPTGLMKDLGYGAAYRYAHDGPGHYLPQDYLPASLKGQAFYRPGGLGFEIKVAERLKWWKERGNETPSKEE
jgi:putative ATPase